MSVRNRSSYSSRHTERSRAWGLLRGAFVLLLLAILSFALGFFVLARILPGDRPAETPGSTAPSPSSGDSSASGPANPAPSIASGIANASPAPRENLPGPTIDPEDSQEVQPPDPLDDASGGASSLFSDGNTTENREPENNTPTPRLPESSARNPVGTVPPEAESGNAALQSRERDAVQPPARIDRPRATVSTPPEAATRAQEPATASSETESGTTNGLFRVQVGVYSTREAAEREAQRLTAQGLSANVQAATIAGRALFRVQHGAFRNRANAEAARERLKAAGVDSTLSQSE